MKQVLIIGMGLMGGSLAAALKKNTNLEIVGVDIDPKAITTAMDKKIIHRGYTDFHDHAPLADIIILATPIKAIIDIIPIVGRIAKKGAIVTDLGSTKTDIMHLMDVLPNTIEAIGGHPMCGKFQSGVDNADGELFREKIYVLVPGKRTGQRTLDLMENLIYKIGGRSKILTALEHDRCVCITSHLPRVLPVAILSMMNKEDSKEIWELAGGNLRNSTMLANDNIRMWLDVILTNKENLSNTIDNICSELEELASEIRNGDADVILRILEKAKADWNDHLGDQDKANSSASSMNAS